LPWLADSNQILGAYFTYSLQNQSDNSHLLEQITSVRKKSCQKSVQGLALLLKTQISSQQNIETKLYFKIKLAE